MGRAVAFFWHVVYRARHNNGDLPMQNMSQFMFTPTSLDALLLSMQYQSPMGIWPDSLFPRESLGCETNCKAHRLLDCTDQELLYFIFHVIGKTKQSALHFAHWSKAKLNLIGRVAFIINHEYAYVNNVITCIVSWPAGNTYGKSVW